MKDLLSEDSEIDEPKVFTLPSPVYHWAGWDGHTGGVTAIHLDSWGLVAVNACKHQVIFFELLCNSPKIKLRLSHPYTHVPLTPYMI